MRSILAALALSAAVSTGAYAGDVPVQGAAQAPTGSIISLPTLNAILNGSSQQTPGALTVSVPTRGLANITALAQQIVSAGGSTGGVGASVTPGIITLNNVTIITQSGRAVKVNITVDRRTGRTQFRRV